jgi:hypothetical protein
VKTEGTYTTTEGHVVDLDRLNEARWRACDYPSGLQTMEEASALADAAVCGYLGIQPYEWAEMLEACEAE